MVLDKLTKGVIDEIVALPNAQCQIDPKADLGFCETATATFEVCLLFRGIGAYFVNDVFTLMCSAVT